MTMRLYRRALLVCVAAGTAAILAGLASQRGGMVDFGIGTILVCTLVSLLEPLLRGIGLLDRETQSSREEEMNGGKSK